MRQSMNIVDMLSIICFYLTVETMNDNQMLEKHLEQQDQKMDKILEVLKYDGR